MSKPDYNIGFEKGGMEPYAHVQVENIESEVEPGEINLRSFRIVGHLEGDIWDGDGNLDGRVRLKLMDIAQDFWESCNIRWVKPKGLVMTGSICNYNWSSYSDIDLHLVVNFDDIHERTDFVQEYFDDKKNEWNDTHKYLKIYGYPVELYVENVGAHVESGGIYDVWQNRWIKEPGDSMLRPIKLNKYAIKDISSKLMTAADELEKEYIETDDNHKIEEIGKKCDILLRSIKDIRTAGLEKGEMGTGNIVYKVLRRSGYLEKLWELKEKIYDDLNSIDGDDKDDEKSFEERIIRSF